MGKSSRRTPASKGPSTEKVNEFIQFKRRHYIEVANRTSEGSSYKKFNARAAKIYTYAYNRDKENYYLYKQKWIESANVILQSFHDNEQMLKALHNKMTQEMQQIICMEHLIFR